MADATTKRSKSSKEIDAPADPSTRDSGSSDPPVSEDVTDSSDDAAPAEETDSSDHPVDDEAEQLPEEAEEEAEMEEEASVQKEKAREKRKRRPSVKRVLEYDLWDMYPEMSLLTQNTKKEWNYSDAEIIRALWLEAKTNALREWKYRNTRIALKKKPTITVQSNHAVQLRLEHREQIKERQKEILQRDTVMRYVGRDAPDFKELQLPTTVTAQMRYKFHRDNPPVPQFYLHHFEKFRKPPFKTKVNPNPACKP